MRFNTTTAAARRAAKEKTLARKAARASKMRVVVAELEVDEL